MVERRKPLVLSSTKALINSVLSSSGTKERDGIDRNSHLSGEDKSPILLFPAGILRLSKERTEVSHPNVVSLDDSALVGLPTSVLKKLSITSGSLILVKNVETNTQRIGQVVVLDPPNTHEHSSENKLPFSHSPRVMLVFPSYHFPQNHHGLLDQEAAYLSPLLAFNLSLHVSCLKSLVHHGKETLASFFEVKMDDETNGKGIEDSVISLGLEPWAQLPRYASHLRASFVKIPECGTLESLKGSSPIEAEDRQEMIDLALHKYFEIDRFLSRGDLFSVCINWNCKSALCIPCSQKMQNASDNIIYFKAVAMEPSDEPVLRVNCTQTALVLGGTVPSAVPPDLLIARPKDFVPLQVDAVRNLASILTPTLCPSALSSKFRVAVLLYGLPGCGKRTVIKYVARRLGLHVVEYSCHNLMAERKTSVALAQAFTTAHRYSPTILLLRHFDVFRNLVSHEGSPHDQVGINSEVASVIREFTEPVIEDKDIYSEENSNGDSRVKSAERISRHPVLLVAASDSSEGLPPTIRRCFSHEISMGPLTEEQRVEMLSQSLQHVSELLPNTSSEDLIKDIVGQTSGFMPRDMRALIADAGANLISNMNIQYDKFEPGNSGEKSSLGFKAVQENKSCDDVPRVLGKEDLAKALERSKKRNASALGTPKVPNVKWEDVGGLEDVKKSILDTVQLPLLHKDLFSSGLRKRSGVLLYGPPGTGKTLLAKAVATECSLNFLSVKGPELINMYIGESEKNVRDIFQKARSARPCVIFFDELDSLAPARGASGDSGGVMDRVVSQMLAEIDGLNDSTQDLFIIGASNRPDLIDSALLRPGRFDKLLYVGVNSDTSYRERVLKALTRKFKLHEDVSLYSVAKKCPPNFTGADMYALCADAWFHAAKRKVLDSPSDSTGKDDQPNSIIVEYDDFVKVLRELSPSLSVAELKKYELLRDQFEGASR
uniref:Peroxisomal ATPase PEX6 n=1 Tax=Davidia involucrata TaxID=16924 RepID=A0A5B7CCG5_DAVIN